MNQSVAWVFTIQNPQPKEDRPALWLEVSYLAYQLEGPHLHYQGYVEFIRPYTFDEVKRLHSKAYWAPARAGRDKNTKYCTKERTRLASASRAEDYLESIKK